jgi:hypothetical protein
MRQEKHAAVHELIRIFPGASRAQATPHGFRYALASIMAIAREGRPEATVARRQGAAVSLRAA